MQPTPLTVLVTGAGGTVGAYVVDELVRAGHRVVACDLPGAPIAAESSGAVEVRRADLTCLSACVDAVRGVDIVIHTAATIDLALPEARIRAINTEAVRLLYEAARAAGCRRFVHFSSGSIYARARGPIHESTPFNPLSAYERSKVAAERYLWSRPRTGLEVTVLRPSMIYGPRGRFLGAKLACLPPLQALVLSRIPVIEGGPRCNWVHAEDVARAAVHLMDRQDAAWRAFNVADETPLSIGEVLRTVAEAYGLPAGVRVPFPTRAARWAGGFLKNRTTTLAATNRVIEQLWRALCRFEGIEVRVLPSVDREMFDYATADTIFDTQRLGATGFRCRHKSLAEGYAAVLRWYQQSRWMPRYEGRTREWGGAVGVHFAETMAGQVRWTAGGQQPFAFTVAAQAPSIRAFARDGRLDLSGTVDAGGLCRGAACTGTLTISGRRRELAYDLAFTGDDHKRYTFFGRKEVKLTSFLRTMTTLPGAVAGPSGEVIGRAVLRFDVRRDLASFARSFRFASPRQAAPERPDDALVRADW